jgi:hypothetical protein
VQRRAMIPDKPPAAAVRRASTSSPQEPAGGLRMRLLPTEMHCGRAATPKSARIPNVIEMSQGFTKKRLRAFIKILGGRGGLCAAKRPR